MQAPLSPASPATYLEYFYFSLLRWYFIHVFDLLILPSAYFPCHAYYFLFNLHFLSTLAKWRLSAVKIWLLQYLLQIAVRVYLLIKEFFIWLRQFRSQVEIFFSRKTNVDICTCCQVNENCLRSINMTYPSWHHRFRFQRGLHNPHQSLSFSSKAEYYRSINILLYYVCFCYLSVPMNNTQLYWTCASLIPTGLWHVIALFPKWGNKMKRDQKPGFDTSAYPVEFLNSGNDPIAACEGFTWSKLQLLQTKSVAKSVWSPSAPASQWWVQREQRKLTPGFPHPVWHSGSRSSVSITQFCTQPL